MATNENSFLVIQKWMLDDYGLKGNDLLVYARIYSFSQDKQGCFWGSLENLAEWTNSTIQGVSKNLKNLMKKGLLSKKSIKQGYIKLNTYIALKPKGEKKEPLNKVSSPLNKVESQLNKVSSEIKQSLTEAIKQSLNNNKVYNKEYSKVDDSPLQQTQDNNLNKIETENDETKSQIKTWLQSKDLSLNENQISLIANKLKFLNTDIDYLNFAWQKIISKYSDKNRNEYLKLFVSAVLNWNDLFDTYKNEQPQKADPWENFKNINPPRICPHCKAKMKVPYLEDGYTVTSCQCGYKATFDFYSPIKWIEEGKDYE